VSERIADEDLTDAVDRYMHEIGWAEADLPIVDVLVVIHRRGFDREGGKSVTSTIVPTDTPVPTLLGMCRSAQMRFEKLVSDSFVDPEG
jgi:hypothetical protein